MKKGIDYIGIGVSFICHDGNGRYLFAKRSENARDEHGVWELPGGGLDFGESIEEGMKRELKEEFCVAPVEFEFLGPRELYRILDGAQSHWIMMDFKVLINPNEVKIGEPHKCDAIEWFELTTLPSPLHSAVHQVIEKNKKFLF